MSDLLDFAEKAGLENIRFRLQNAETLAKEAGAMLMILLAGIGAAMAYAVKAFEQPAPTMLAMGAAALCAWLMLTAIILVIFCILATDLPAPTNEPLNLYQKDHPLDIIREVELRNLDARIKQVTARNQRVAAWLDRSRMLAIASPLIFLLTALASAAR